MEIFLGIIITLIVILYFWYVSIIGKRNTGLEALSGIDVQLKKRSNLIPNILKIAQKFLEHEKSLITEITELREQADKGYDKTDKNEVQHQKTIEDIKRRLNADTGMINPPKNLAKRIFTNPFKNK